MPPGVILIRCAVGGTNVHRPSLLSLLPMGPLIAVGLGVAIMPARTPRTQTKSRLNKCRTSEEHWGIQHSGRITSKFVSTPVSGHTRVSGRHASGVGEEQSITPSELCIREEIGCSQPIQIKVTWRIAAPMRTLALFCLLFGETYRFQAAESSLTIHGRAHVYGGDSQLRIWLFAAHLNTNRMSPPGLWSRDGWKPE
jgi:hypothetical protein